MKRLMLLGLAFAATLIVLVGCSSASTPTDALSNYLSAVKSGNVEAAQKYYAGTFKSLGDAIGDEAASVSSEVSADDASAVVGASLVPKLQDFSYELSNEQVNGDSASVDMTITTYNAGDAMTDFVKSYFTEALSSVLSGASQDEINALSASILQEKVDGMEKSYTATVSVPLVKVDGEWKVAECDTNSDLFNALTGGMISSLSGIADAFGSLSSNSSN